MNQIAVLELKHTVTKIKKLIDGFNYRINNPEENICELEEKSYFRWKHSKEKLCKHGKKHEA